MTMKKNKGKRKGYSITDKTPGGIFRREAIEAAAKALETIRGVDHITLALISGIATVLRLAVTTESGPRTFFEEGRYESPDDFIAMAVVSPSGIDKYMSKDEAKLVAKRIRLLLKKVT